MIRPFRSVVFISFLTSSALIYSRPLAAQKGCGLDSRNSHNVTLPAVAEGVMGSDLAARFQRGYDVAFVQSQTEAGKRELQALAAESTANGNICGEALAQFGLGQATREGDLSESLQHFQKAEKLLQDVGTPLALAHVHQRIAVTEHLLGNNEAFLQADPAVQTEFHDGGDEAMAIMEKSLALQYSGTGQHPAEQLALLQELGTVQAPNATAVRGFVEWQVGSSLRRTGRFAEIKQHFDAALAALAECDCGHATRAAIFLSTAAGFDAGNDGESVLFYARQADEIYVKYHLEAERTQSLRLIAAGYAHQHDWTRAVATNTKALEVARARHNAVATATVGLELADNYGSSGDPVKGLDVLQSTALPKPNAEQLCNVEAQRMMLEDEAHLYPQAEADAVLALSGCRETLQPSTVALVSVHLAQTLLAQGRAEESLAHSQEAVRIIESQRQRLQPTDRALRAFNERNALAYNVLISTYTQLKRPDDGLLASEQFRARAFFDLASSLPSAPIAAPSSAANPATTATLPDPPAAEASRRNGRPVAAIASEVKPFSGTVEDMRALVDAQHSTLISYWLTNEGKLYTWVIAPGKPVTQTTRQLEPQQLATLVRATLPVTDAAAHRSQVITRGGQSESVVAVSRQPWRALYRLLIAPIAQQLPQEEGSLLTIVPQGALFQLSFPALLDERGHYLIERYAIHTVPSVRTLQLTSRNEVASAGFKSHYLLVANSDEFPKVDGHSLPQLPGTMVEVERIQQRLRGASVTLLEGKNAGIVSMVSALPESTVLHIATHAVVKDDAPMASFLALDRSQKGGVLTARALYDLRLHDTLVVLSACSTGRGTITGDGVAGLSRAFLAAGAASLLSTLWDVVDAPTADFMDKFYAGLSRGKTHSAALREAQLSLIHDLRAHQIVVKTLSGSTVSLPESPAYWAAFSLTGQP